jgi:hypothetical protein
MALFNCVNKLSQLNTFMFQSRKIFENELLIIWMQIWVCNFKQSVRHFCNISNNTGIIYKVLV